MLCAQGRERLGSAGEARLLRGFGGDDAHLDQAMRADDPQLQRYRERPLQPRQRAMDVVDAGDGLVVDADDDVADLDAGRLGRTAIAKTGHFDAARMPEPQLAHHVARNRTILAPDPQPAAANAPARQELAYDPRRSIDGDAEAYALRAEDHRRVEADDAPARVDERPA